MASPAPRAPRSFARKNISSVPLQHSSFSNIKSIVRSWKQPRRLAARTPAPAATTPLSQQQQQPSSSSPVPPLRAELERAIQEAVLRGSALTHTDLPLPGKRVGKVRDTYDLGGDRIVVVTTDRQSAFDRLLASVPFKGQVLNQTAAWWFAATAHIAPNALLAVPHPNVAVMRRCEVFPVEFVVRGFATGSTDTSLWTRYAAGDRVYCGHALPEGLRKNARLAAPLLTPTTKSDAHDELISAAEIVERGLMSATDWEAASRAALALFAFGQDEAAKRGLLLVDTKYEFGRDPATGEVLLLDEVHTPDSSRYWLVDTYAARHAAGEEPDSVDKEFLRLWFRARCDPYADAELPPAPPELVAELSRRYVYLYEAITGQPFAPEVAAAAGAEEDGGNARIARAIAQL